MGSDFRVCFIFIAAHDKDPAGFVGHHCQCLIHEPSGLRAENFLRIAGFKGGNPQTIHPLLMLLDTLFHIFADTKMTKVIQTFMFDRFQDIGRNIRIGRKRMAIFPIIHDSLNSNIFRCRFILQVRIGETHKQSMIFGKQLIKSFYLRGCFHNVSFRR